MIWGREYPSRSSSTVPVCRHVRSSKRLCRDSVDTWGLLHLSPPSSTFSSNLIHLQGERDGVGVRKREWLFLGSFPAGKCWMDSSPEILACYPGWEGRVWWSRSQKCRVWDGRREETLPVPTENPSPWITASSNHSCGVWEFWGGGKTPSPTRKHKPKDFSLFKSLLWYFGILEWRKTSQSQRETQIHGFHPPLGAFPMEETWCEPGSAPAWSSLWECRSQSIPRAPVPQECSDSTLGTPGIFKPSEFSPSLILQRKLQRNSRNGTDDSSQIPGNRVSGRAALGFFREKAPFLLWIFLPGV